MDSSNNAGLMDMNDSLYEPIYYFINCAEGNRTCGASFQYFRELKNFPANYTPLAKQQYSCRESSIQIFDDAVSDRHW